MNKKQNEAEEAKKQQLEGEEEVSHTQTAAAEEEDGTETAKVSEETKQPSENDILKIYLEQSFAEIKRLKGETESLKKELEETKIQTLEFKNRLESNIGEYENFRRRTAIEKENIYAEAVSKAITELLPSLDSLERSITFVSSNPESFIQGVEMTLRQLEGGFERLGVTEIEAQGAEFNPDKHNAVTHVEDESLGESVVAEVFQKGYAIGDKVIRHSVVKVAN